MGADGGVNWVITSDVKQFEELVRPLGLLWDTGNYYDYYHLEWMEKNLVPGNVVSRYGTNCRRQGLDELEELLKELKHYLTAPLHEWDYYWQHTQTNPLDLTWEGLLTDFYTHPIQENYPRYMIPQPVSIMLEDYSMFYDRENMVLNFEKYPTLNSKIFRMTLRDWLQEICNITLLNSFGSAETWT